MGGFKNLHMLSKPLIPFDLCGCISISPSPGTVKTFVCASTSCALLPAPRPVKFNLCLVGKKRIRILSGVRSADINKTTKLGRGRVRSGGASLPMFAQSCSTFYIVVGSILCRCVFLCCTLAAMQISPLITNNLLKNYTCKSSKTASLEPVA